MNEMKDALPLKISLKRSMGGMAALCNRFRAGDTIRALIYHKITDGYVPSEWDQMTTPRSLFESQVKFLKDNGYRSIGAADLVGSLKSGAASKEKLICITFDDGYLDNYRNAFPVLKKYGFNATVFLTSDFIINADRAALREYLNWAEIAEMRKSGVFTFGCHSASHPNLSTLGIDEMAREIKDAKRALEDGIGEKVLTYAYPFGWQSSYNKDVRDMVEAAGFTAAYTGVHGANGRHTDPFYLRRIRVSWLEELDEFEKLLGGAYDWYSLYQRIVSLWHRA